MRLSKFPWILVFCFTGCVVTTPEISSGSKSIADEKVVGQIEKGKATKASVEALLGKPASVDFTDGGLEKWVYQYSHAPSRQVNIFDSASLVSMEQKLHTLTIVFKGGLVENVGKGESVIMGNQAAPAAASSSTSSAVPAVAPKANAPSKP